MDRRRAAHVDVTRHLAEATFTPCKAHTCRSVFDTISSVKNAAICEMWAMRIGAVCHRVGQGANIDNMMKNRKHGPSYQWPQGWLKRGNQ